MCSDISLSENFDTMVVKEKSEVVNSQDIYVWIKVELSHTSIPGAASMAKEKLPFYRA